MRHALAERNFKEVFYLLRSHQMSQRVVCRLTGISSATHHAITCEGRVVKDRDVLIRIADGLGIPHGYIGMAYDDSTQRLLTRRVTRRANPESEQHEVRELLRYASTVATGTNVDDDGPSWWLEAANATTSPPPEHVGDADVASLRKFIADMRSTDYQFGGGPCLEPVTASTWYVEHMLRSDYSKHVGAELIAAAADLRNLAGWTAFDVGQYSLSRRHFRRALGLARHAEDHSLLSNILYRAGRLHLHREMPQTALRFFQLGQLTAQDAGCSLTVSMLHANEGWAYALLGNHNHMLQSLRRAEDEFANADLGRANAWVRFFGEADLHALAGVTMTAYAEASTAELDTGIEHLNHAIDLRGDSMARSRAFEFAALATAHLHNGDRDEGLTWGTTAVEAAGVVRSVRTVDRLAPLRAAADKRRGDSGLDDLIHTIDALKVTT